MSFHNIPPNGFPDIPGMEELEAVVKDVASLKSGLISFHGMTDITNTVRNVHNTYTATDNCILWVHIGENENYPSARPYLHYRINNVLYDAVNKAGTTLDINIFLQTGDTFKCDETFPYETVLPLRVLVI